MTTTTIEKMADQAEKILERLRRCTKVSQVNEVAKDSAEVIKLIDANPDPSKRVRGIHIRNLAKLKRSQIMRDKHGGQS